MSCEMKFPLGAIGAFPLMAMSMHGGAKSAVFANFDNPF
jgi:hypothetical protein